MILVFPQNIISQLFAIVIVVVMANNIILCVSVYQHLLDMDNYSTSLFVLNGLCHSSVMRLRKSHQIVGKSSLHKLDKM